MNFKKLQFSLGYLMLLMILLILHLGKDVKMLFQTQQKFYQKIAALLISD